MRFLSSVVFGKEKYESNICKANEFGGDYDSSNLYFIAYFYQYRAGAHFFRNLCGILIRLYFGKKPGDAILSFISFALIPNVFILLSKSFMIDLQKFNKNIN